MARPRRPAPTYDARQSEQMRALDGRRLASFRRRAAALALDFVIAGALFLPLVTGVGLLLVRTGLWKPEGDVTLHLTFFDNWYSIVWLVLYFGLTTWWWKGQTLGKRLLRIRVVPLHHDHLSLWHSIERALGYGASALELGFGFFQYFLHPNRQTVHDRIAETIVVDERVPSVADRRSATEHVAAAPPAAELPASEPATPVATPEVEREPSPPLDDTRASAGARSSLR